MWLDDHKKSFYKAWWETKFQPAALKGDPIFQFPKESKLGSSTRWWINKFWDPIFQGKKREGNWTNFSCWLWRWSLKPDRWTLEQCKKWKPHVRGCNVMIWNLGSLERNFWKIFLKWQPFWLLSGTNIYIYPIKNGKWVKNHHLQKGAGRDMLVPRRVSWFVLEVAKLVD